MYSDRALKNFATYLKVTPKHLLGRRSPLGAYDARGGARAHGFDRAFLTHEELERGGRLDYVGKSRDAAGGGVEEAMKFIAERLSPEDWADFQDILKGDDDQASDDLPSRKENGMPHNALSAMDAALRLTPDLSRIHVGE